MDEVTFEHKKLGIKATIKSLKQRDLEAFGAAISKEPKGSKSQDAGANVRAAIQAGWFTELTPVMTVEQVGDQSPAVIRFLGAYVDAVYQEVTTIPPE